ncbi:MAG TPA: hypothetical protein VF428_05835 [Casimicrobiaceae bacterium]
MLVLAVGHNARADDGANGNAHDQAGKPDRAVQANSAALIDEGRRTFRFDTFGDEAFWGDQLQLHTAIEGSKLGGVGPGVSPRAALALGMKVDADALPGNILGALRSGHANLDDPATTLALLKANAVVGVTGFFNSNGTLKSIGIQCALCHSTVDNSLAPGIGRRLDGWANHDLDVGRLIASAPNLAPVVAQLSVVHPGITENDVRAVLQSWGPGKFDAELNLDGKTVNPAQVTDGVTTGTMVPGATLIPNAFGLAGFNLHTWTGAWGTVSYWNAFVATLEMRGIGRFFDPRLNDAAQFPIAAAFGFGNLNSTLGPDDDRVAAKLPALHFYELALPAPTPRAGVDFDAAAAKRGDDLFSGKAGCNNCHVDPLWTEPGWNLHPAADICIDDFEANRAPDHSYKTMTLNALFVREEGLFVNAANKGRYYHDGRFKTLLDVVNHYNTCKSLGLTDQEKHDLVEYLKSLPES